MIRKLQQPRFFLRNVRGGSEHAVKIFRFGAGKEMGLSLMGDARGVKTTGVNWYKDEIFRLGVSEITKDRAEELMPGVSTFSQGGY